jgi:Flp pilus assembly protein TadD
MSLINQMLRDLEQRRDDEADPRRVRAVGDSPRRLSLWPWLAVLAVLLPVMAGLAWLYLPLSLTDPAEEASAPTASAMDDEPLPLETPAPVLPDIRPAEQAAAPVSLLALERVETRDGQRLRLDFDGDSAYRRRASGDDRLVLEVKAELPADMADTLPPGVSEFRDHDVNGERRRIELVLADGWEAGPLYLETAPGGGDRLSLALRRVDRPAVEPDVAEENPAEAIAEAPEESATGDDDADELADQERPTSSLALDDDDLSEQAMVRERRQRTDEERADEAWAEARDALRRGRVDAAESALSRVLSLHPAHVPARDALADLLADTGRPEDADQVLADSLTVAELPASELGFFARQRARLWLERDDAAQGIAALEQVYPDRDAAPESGALLAGLYYRQGDYRRAVEHYRELVEQRPEQGAWWMGMGLALEGMADFDAAAEAYRQALAGDGLGPSVRDYLQARLRELSD